METRVNVLVTSPIGQEALQKLCHLSPRLKVMDVSGLCRLEQSGDTGAKKDLDALLADAEVFYGLRFPQGFLRRAPRLKWVQVMSAGVDRHLNDPELVKSQVVMTNISGMHAITIAEFNLSLMLMFVKGAHLCFRAKQEKHWERYSLSVLRSKTVGIVGLGSIGRETARLAKAFGMKVLATRRSMKQVGKTRYVDVMLPASELPGLLKESDFVVLTLPLTDETRKLIGEQELRLMKPDAYLINVARGEIVDEPVLIRALEEHWIAGAGLDVFATEPLPADSKLWELPNVILSPHIAGGMEDYTSRATDIFMDNLKRYLSGRRLSHMVNKQKGY